MRNIRSWVRRCQSGLSAFRSRKTPFFGWKNAEFEVKKRRFHHPKTPFFSLKTPFSQEKTAFSNRGSSILCGKVPFSVFRTAKRVLNSAEMRLSLSCFAVKVLRVTCREFCEMIVVIRLFAWLKVAKSGLNAGFCGWERGFLWWVLPIYIWFSVFLNSVCAFLNSVRRVCSGFQWVCMLENGVIDWRCGGCGVGFLYVSCFVRRNSFANVVFAVGDAAEVRFGVPKWLWIRGFAWWVAAVANSALRVCSGFQAVCMLENGVIDWRCGESVVGFLYVSCFVRRNSFANVVFAVGDAAEVRCKVPKWLLVRGFAWRVAAVAGRSVGFIGYGIGFCCHVRAVSGRERGFACRKSGVCVVGLFRFRVVKRKRTPCGVPKNKNEKIKYRFYEPFSFVSFSAFAWCKGSVFFVCFGEKLVFFAVFNRCFPCLRGGFRGFSGWFRRKRGLFRGLRGSNAAVAVFEKAVKFYCKGRYVGGGGCYDGSVYAVSGYESEACEEGDG